MYVQVITKISQDKSWLILLRKLQANNQEIEPKAPVYSGGGGGQVESGRGSQDTRGTAPPARGT
jgi:hypothetical protein